MAPHQRLTASLVKCHACGEVKNRLSNAFMEKPMQKGERFATMNEMKGCYGCRGDQQNDPIGEPVKTRSFIGLRLSACELAKIMIAWKWLPWRKLPTADSQLLKSNERVGAEMLEVAALTTPNGPSDVT